MTGTFLVKLARVIFDRDVLAAVVAPAIADMQQEVRSAGSDRRRRIRARLHGYIAFWTLVLLAPVAAHAWPVRRDEAMVLPARSTGAGGWLLLAGVLAFSSPALSPWTVATIVGGSIVAIVIHVWYGRHPLLLATPNGNGTGRPEINFSRLPVGGNIGGLIFMAGSMAILVAGLPAWRWFFGVAVAGGFLTAAIVFRWRAAHPMRGLPQNLIVLR